MENFPSQVSLVRRQHVILITGVILLGLYFVMQAVPASLGTGFALTVALLISCLGFYFAGFARLTSRQGRVWYLLVPAFLFAVLTILLLPNFRRAALAKRLADMGAKVEASTDAGNSVWFRFHGIHLPCWFKDQLGDSFFGSIEKVDFSNSTVPPALVDLEFEESIDILNLSFAEITQDDLLSLAGKIDAGQVLLNSVPVNSQTLARIGKMPSLHRVVLIDSQVSKEDALDFLLRHPKVNVVYGNGNSYGMLMPPQQMQ